jgi:hypothetical protein
MTHGRLENDQSLDFRGMASGVGHGKNLSLSLECDRESAKVNGLIRFFRMKVND